VRATGPAGHGSRFVAGTATEKLLRFANKVMAFRAQQAAALEASCGCGKGLGDFTTMNLSMLKAGSLEQFQFNVIPTEAFAGFDCRIPCTVDLAEFRRQLDSWCSEDPGVTYDLVAGSETGALTHAVSDISEGAFWWRTFLQACSAAKIDLHPPSVFPAATDSRWIRLVLGTPCFGFSPIRRTPILLHDHDEHLPVDVFIEGIRSFEALLPTLADAPPELHPPV
jgi:aminoacylase